MLTRFASATSGMLVTTKAIKTITELVMTYTAAQRSESRIC